MAIASIDRQEALTPKTLKAPKTWGDLQALNSLIPSHFQEERYAALTSKNGEAFGSLDCMLASAVWSRRDTDNPAEALPTDLQTAASEMLALMNIRAPESTSEQATGGRQILARIGAIATSLKQRLYGATVASTSK